MMSEAENWSGEADNGVLLDEIRAQINFLLLHLWHTEIHEKHSLLYYLFIQRKHLENKTEAFLENIF